MAKYGKEIVERICNNIRDGDTQKDAAAREGVAESTLYDWLANKVEFMEAVKKAKEDFQKTIVGKLEKSLYKKALGYSETETEEEYYFTKDGARITTKGKKKTKHIQPDTGALIFALTNLAPDKWKNKQKQEIEVSPFEELMKSLPELPEDKE